MHKENKIFFLAPSGFVRVAAERFWNSQMESLRKVAVCSVFHYEECTSIEDAAEKLVRNLPRADIILIACSLGSMVAVEAVRRLLSSSAMTPRNKTDVPPAINIKGICLISTSVKAESEDKKSERMASISKYLEAPSRLAKPLSQKRIAAMIDAQNNPDAVEVLQTLIQTVSLGELANQNHMVANRHDQEEHLHLFGRIPVLIVGGEKDTSITPIDGMRKMHELIPGSQLMVLKNCGHLPPIEKPKEVNDILKSFAHRLLSPRL